MIKLTAPKEMFTNLLDAVLVMQKEALVILSPEGVKCNVGSLDGIAAVFIDYPKEMFTTYEVNETVKFGLKADDVKKRLARCGSSVTIEQISNNEIQIQSDDKKYGVALFNTQGFDKEPKFTFPTKIKLPRSDLLRILGDVAVTTQFLTLSTNGDKVTFSGRGDLASDNVNVSPPELADVEGESSLASYLLATYLIPMVSAVDVETVYLEFGTGKPLSVTLGNVKYFLGAKGGA
jgi:DNA polymerase III sliding clamp (beta) subunit (PCNA family)